MEEQRRCSLLLAVTRRWERLDWMTLNRVTRQEFLLMVSGCGRRGGGVERWGRLEVEYLLLALDFGEILLLFAAFGPLQAALLQVFEAGGHGGALGRPRRVTAVLWGPGDTQESHQFSCKTRTTASTCFKNRTQCCSSVNKATIVSSLASSGLQ